MRDDICPVSASADTDAPYQRMHKQLICKQKKLRFLISRNFLYQTFFFTMKLLIQSSFLPLQPSAKWLLQKKKKVFPQTLGFYQKQPSLNLQGNITFVSWCSSWPEETLREFFLTVWFGWTRATALRNVFKDSGFIPLTAWQQMKIQTNRISSPVEFSTRCVTMLVNPDSGALEKTQTIWKS